MHRQAEDQRPLVADNGSINARQGEVEGGTPEEEEKVNEMSE